MTISFDEFIAKWLSKKADWDNAYGGQCVDLFRYYNDEVLGISQPKSVNGAADFWNNYSSDPVLTKNFIKINNTPDGLPQKGDVMIWNKRAGGGYGHIAMFISGTVDSFTSLDQNWPTLSEVTHTVHSYTNLYGWFRPVKEVTVPDEEEDNKKGIYYPNIDGYGPVDFGDEKQVADFVDEYQKERGRTSSCRDEYEKLQDDFDKYISETDKKIQDLENDLYAYQEEASQYQKVNKDNLAWEAKALNKTQDVPKIRAEITRLVGVSDMLTTLRDDHGLLEDKFGVVKKENKEFSDDINTLKYQLKQAKGLADANEADLLAELISKMLKRISNLIRNV